MSDQGIVRTSFAFSAADEAALADRVAALRKAGGKPMPLRVLRAIIYMASANDIIAHSVRLSAEYAQKGGAEPPTKIRPTLALDQAQLKLLDDAVQQLGRAHIVATRTFVVRALLHAAPKGQAMVKLYQAFEERFPMKPRGISKIQLERKARGAG
jgi:hypothetical protein